MALFKFFLQISVVGLVVDDQNICSGTSFLGLVFLVSGEWDHLKGKDGYE